MYKKIISLCCPIGVKMLKILTLYGMCICTGFELVGAATRQCTVDRSGTGVWNIYGPSCQGITYSS